MIVNNIEVTVNTCTRTDVFTVITTKDQSGRIHNNYSPGGQEFMAISKQTSSSGYALQLGLFTAINPWHLCYNYMWQSHVEIEGYSVMYFNRIAACAS